MRRAVIVLATCFIATVLPASSSYAGTAIERWTDNQGIGAGVTNNVATGSEIKGGVCTYSKLGPAYDQMNDTERQRQLAMGNQKSAEQGAWYLRKCVDDQGNSDNLIMWIVSADPTALALQALQYVPIAAPAININPAVNRDQIVNLPSWLWVDGAAWTPQSATASDGTVTVATTASPVRVIWNTGDGEQTICSGPGVAYDSSALNSAQHTDCSHTYRHSSADQPDGKFTLTATVEWNVNWAATGLPAGEPANGTLNNITRTSTTTVRVAEIQALNQQSH